MTEKVCYHESMTQKLTDYLNSLERDACYRVETVLKKTAYEETQKVWFSGANGAEQGPYIRKIINIETGLGSAYERIWVEQEKGTRFYHIPRMLDYYTTESARVVIMEYLQAETLEEVVYRCDPSVVLAADVFPRICSAVQELHERFDPPIVHRDLKPSNIMLSRDETTVIDFGIARTYREGVLTDTAHFGTKPYAPPEQFGFGQTDVRSDVYALGLLLFYCLVEKTPDANDRKRNFAHKWIPEPLRAVIAKAAAFDPDDRYVSISDLLLAFNEAVSILSATIQPVCPNVSNSVSAPMPKSLSNIVQRCSGFMARVPYSLGVIWDVLLVLILALFLLAAIEAGIAPKQNDTLVAYSLEIRVFLNLAILFLVVVPVAYLITDRRPIRKLFPFFAARPLWQECLVVVCLFMLCAVVFGVTSLLAS